MLRNLLNLLTMSIKIKSNFSPSTTQAPPSQPKSKPLVIQTAYLSTNNASLVKNNKFIPICISNEELLTSHEKLLELYPVFAYSTIENYQLEKNTSLIGMTRHARRSMIFNNIFMYSVEIFNTNEWESMQQKAQNESKSIALFQTLQSTPCLKITDETGEKNALFLIHHQVVQLQKILYKP